MASTASLNFTALDAFADEERDDIDIEEMHEWFDKLVEYQPDSDTSEKQLRSLFQGMKVLANFSFTAAEELRDVAEKEAVAAAERETALQGQLSEANEELDTLRDRLTVGAAGAGSESAEAFRAQVTALKDENHRLAQMGRERDRELADQRDRYENVLARAEGLHRERDNLLYNKSQLEETIGELNRRIKAKTEGGEHEWEMRKLRQRNDQAMQLSQQLNDVVAQNDALREEVQRVGAALEQATKLIESTTARYEDMSSRLVAATATIGELENERMKFEEELGAMKEAEAARLIADGEGELRSEFETAVAQLKSELALREQDVSDMRATLSAMASRVEWAEARADVGTEKEEHLEKLRLQLARATKEAKDLLGYEGPESGGPDTGAGGPAAADDGHRRALLQTQHALAIAHDQLQERRKEMERMEAAMEEKDTQHAAVHEEVSRLREIKLGDAATMLADLKRQLGLRDAQIAKLNQICSLLHVELGRYARREEEGDWPASGGPREAGHRPDKAKERPDKGRPTRPPRRGEVKKEEEEVVDEEEVEEKTPQPKPRRSTGGRRVHFPPPPSTASVEEQSMLLASLYYETILLIEELEGKESRLREAERVIAEGSSRMEQSRMQLRMAYEHIATIEGEKKDEDEEGNERDDKAAMRDAEIQQLRILADSIRKGGSELERRAEEMSRKLIGENLERIRLARRLARIEKRLEVEEKSVRTIRERALAVKSEGAMENIQLQKQLDDAWSSEARLQRLLLDCVPREIYSQLHTKYVVLLRSSTDLQSSGGVEASVAEEIIPDILPQGGSGGGTGAVEGLRKQLDHTKRLLVILEEQADFWRGESEVLTKENGEMRALLDMCENESDASAILVSIETHLLRAIREQASAAREGTRAKEQLRATKTELRRLKGEWASERRHLLAVARLLHSTLRRSQTETLHGISVSQVEIFRDKIADVMTRDARVKGALRLAEEAKREAEEERRHVVVLRQAMDIVDEGDGEALQRALHAVIGREMALKERLKEAVAEVHELKSELRRLAESSLSADEERTLVLEKVEAMLELREAVEEGRRSRGRGREGKEERGQEEDRLSPPPRPPPITTSTTAESSTDEGVTTETDSEREERRKPRIILKTVLHDNSAKFEERLHQMRETADIAIRAYKDQLEQKERALAVLRRLLEGKMDQVRVVEKLEVVREVVKERDASVDAELAAATKERARLERLVADLERANERLFELSQKKDIDQYEAGTQTEPLATIREASELEDTFLSPTAPSPSRPLIDEEAKMVAEDSLRKATARFEYERRSSKQTIAKLTAANNELKAACEEIKRAAMEEMKERMTGRGENSRVHEEQLRLAREEIERYKGTIHRMRKAIDELKRDKDEAAKKAEPSKQDSMDAWHARKRLEESVSKLRAEVKKAEASRVHAEGELAKRERRLAEMEAVERNRQQAMVHLEGQLRAARRQRTSAASEVAEASEARMRLKMLEEQLAVCRAELNDARVRANRLQEERKRQQVVVEKEQRIVKKEVEVKIVEDSTRIQTVERQRRELHDARAKLATLQKKYDDTKEKFTVLEKERADSFERHTLIVERLEREATPVSAIALLQDKLLAKEVEIRHLNLRIGELERERDAR